jgi:uncharacterized protein YxjI
VHALDSLTHIIDQRFCTLFTTRRTNNMGLLPNRPGRGGAAGAGPEVYQMRQNLISIGDDFWIQTQAGRRAFKVDGKALRVRDTLAIRDVQGTEVARLQERLINVRDTMKIWRAGKPEATIKKALITPLRDRFTLTASDIGEIEIQGNFLALEYTFTKNGQKVAETSRKWLRVADTYGVEINPDQDVVLILAATVALDQIAHPGV